MCGCLRAAAMLMGKHTATKDKVKTAFRSQLLVRVVNWGGSAPVLPPALVTGCGCPGRCQRGLWVIRKNKQAAAKVLMWDEHDISAMHALLQKLPPTLHPITPSPRSAHNYCLLPHSQTPSVFNPPASSVLGSSPSTSLPQEGQSRVCDMHERQNVCLQLLTLCASNSSALHTGQCSVLSLGPRELPKPSGHVAAAAGGAGASSVSAAGGGVSAATGCGC